MVGLQVLVLTILVRVQVPQQNKRSVILMGEAGELLRLRLGLEARSDAESADEAARAG